MRGKRVKVRFTKPAMMLGEKINVGSTWNARIKEEGIATIEAAPSTFYRFKVNTDVMIVGSKEEQEYANMIIEKRQEQFDEFYKELLIIFPTFNTPKKNLNQTYKAIARAAFEAGRSCEALNGSRLP